MSMDYKFMNEKDAAVFLGVSVFTMRKWRSRRRGPTYYKFEGCVRYNEPDLEEYRRSKTIPISGVLSNGKETN